MVFKVYFENLALALPLGKVVKQLAPSVQALAFPLLSKAKFAKQLTKRQRQELN
jgi:hypothetical protein